MKIKGKRVASWSLNARKSCPGSKNPDGTIVDVCQGCYATKNMYNFPVVIAARDYNQQDYQKADWVDRMVKQVSKYDYFRWFDSGDVETPELAKKIRAVMLATPNTQHWLPTRSDKIEKIQDVLTRGRTSIYGRGVNYISDLTNVSLRISADHVGLNNKERPGVNSYVINPGDLFECKRQGIFLCPVTSPGSTQKSCDTCTMCYTDKPVAYLVH